MAISSSKLRRDVSELVREYGLVLVLSGLQDLAEHRMETDPEDEDDWDELAGALDDCLDVAHRLER